MPLADEAEALELDLLLEALHRRYGLDFRGYSRDSLLPRVRYRVQAEGLRTVSGLLERVLHDRDCLERLLLHLTSHGSPMFSEPTFYHALREKVMPQLRTYPFIRVWHAGCATGEEVYSTAIVLHEEGLLERCRIYATDLSETVLKKAPEGSFPLAAMQECAFNYILSGGKSSLSAYYASADHQALLLPWLRKNLVFAQHNLVTDASFNEFHLIFCRNVTMYFNKPLQQRVFALIHGSLPRLGILALGRKESIRLSPFHACYGELDEEERLYRRHR
ncbi:MAG: protein-glutamate O-methyltransferase CheR [Planctomycetes bacterium]|nr:protein-glutamate O-methyltransferase CheR [Planctomycetota bacterium]